jgi:hypothetical protein
MPTVPTVLVFDGLILATVAVCRRTVVLLVMVGVRVWVDGVVLLVVVAMVVLRRVVAVVFRAFFLPVLPPNHRHNQVVIITLEIGFGWRFESHLDNLWMMISNLLGVLARPIGLSSM